MSDTGHSVLKIVLVDDHELVREGLRGLLERRPNMRVVGEAATAAQSIEVAWQTKPDIVVMDVRMPDGSGIEACRDIRAVLPDTRVVVLTSYSDEEAVVAAVLAGAAAYVVKHTSSEQLVAVIEAVARGESLVSSQVSGKIVERLQKLAEGSSASRLADLNAHENQILRLIAQGKTNKEIAAEIELSDKTVKNYVSSLLAKLGLKRRSEAAAFIARHTAV